MAVTDSLRICANALPTLRTCDLMDFISEYCSREDVDEILVGLPKRLDGEYSESMTYINPFIALLGKKFPGMKISMYDERFTSVIAHKAMIQGLPKSKRSQKGMADKVAAVIILTDYLQSLGSSLNL